MIEMKSSLCRLHAPLGLLWLRGLRCSRLRRFLQPVGSARSSYLLQQGRFVADVCVYYGDEAPNLVPAKRIAPTVKPRWSEDKCLHCGRPVPVDLRTLGTGYDYDYVNEEVLVERMRVHEGRLQLPEGMKYRILVLPDRETINGVFLGMAIARGLNCPIVDAAKVAHYIQAADLALGRDEYAMRYLKAYRKRQKSK